MNEGLPVITTYNKVAQRYADLNFNATQDLPVVDRFLSHLPQHATILDVGCGPGAMVKYISSKGHTCEGIDLSEQMLKIAQERVPERTFSLMDMRHLQYADETFDGLASIYSLIHIPSAEILSTLREFGRVLKKDGLLLLIVQEGAPDHVANEPLKKDEHIFVNFFTSKRLTQNLVRAGFVLVEQTKCVTGDPSTPGTKKCATKSNAVIYTIARKAEQENLK